MKIDFQLVVLLQTPVEDGMFSLLARAGRQVRLPSVHARVKSTACAYEFKAFFVIFSYMQKICNNIIEAVNRYTIYVIWCTLMLP